MSIVEIVFDGVIIAAGVLLFIRFSGIQRTMKAIEESSRKLYKTVKSGTKLNVSSGSVGLGKNTYEEFDFGRMEETRERFNKENAKYLSRVQLISIFPLLGLLGTVGSLMPGLSAVQNGDFSQLSAALSTALSSTVCGIIVSIVLKFYVSLVVSVTVQGIEDNLDECDRKFSNATSFNMVTRGEE